MKKEKILLITDVVPCESYSGGAMSLQLIKMLLQEKHEVSIFLVPSKAINLPIDESIKDGVEVKVFNKPNECWSGDSNPSYYKKIDKLKGELGRYVKANNFTKIWGIIQGEVTLNLIDYCRLEFEIDYVCQIWDTINWWIRENNFSSKRQKAVMKKYKEVIKDASYCITASWKMSEKLSNKIKNNYIELMPSMEKYEYNKKIEKDPNKFIIAMAGQVYAKKELDSLFQALDNLEWTINGKEVYFYYYGNFVQNYINLHKYKKHSNRIVIKGFVEQNLLLPALAESDILYCPYFFSNDPTYQEVAKTSFPCKLITYLNVPVTTILHAPNYSSPYSFVKKYNCAYMLDSMSVDKISSFLRNVNVDSKSIIKNASKAFEENFTFEKVKQKFFKALNIEYSYKDRMHILEVNNIDLSGKRFNGFDLLHAINDNTNNVCKQIVTYKESNDYNVLKFYKNYEELSTEYKLLELERKYLSVHNVLSLTSNILKNHEEFKKADLVHYHLVDNTKLSLCQLDELCSLKPSIITLHDPWWFTGRCVYPEECNEWKNGCKKCNYMHTLFTLPRDNCATLWKLKENVYKTIDTDIIVSTPFMTKSIEECSMTNFEHVHLLPFGIDLDSFNPKMTQAQAKKYFKIPNDNMVIFLRAQKAHKGTEYVHEAMELLKTDKKITLLTCSEEHLLDDLKDRYNIIDLGNIKDDIMHIAYIACDMFLMPSRGETFGLMAIEAMASSKPIIVFNNSALPYVTFAPDCGVLVENKNSQKLMEAIEMLLNNEDERIRRGKLGRELCEKHYDVNVYNKKMLEIYSKAYKRQKDKDILKCDSTIDYTIPDVKHLIHKLKKIYKKMGFKSKLNSPSFRRKIIVLDNKNYKVDYSLNSVQNVIKEFNDYIYKIYVKEIVNRVPTSQKEHTFVVVHRLRKKYYTKLKNCPVLFRLTRYTYRKIRDFVKIIRYGKKVK